MAAPKQKRIRYLSPCCAAPSRLLRVSLQDREMVFRCTKCDARRTKVVGEPEAPVRRLRLVSSK